MDVVFQSIGLIHSPHKKLSEIPAQPVFARDIEGQVVIDPDFVPGLEGLEGFSHIYLLYHFHQSGSCRLRFKPYLADDEYGIFATRAPHRPNGLGISVVRLIGIEYNVLKVKDIDVLDGTPLLDIKPFVQRFDCRSGVRSGWQEAVSDADARRRGLRDYKKSQ